MPEHRDDLDDGSVVNHHDDRAEHDDYEPLHNGDHYDGCGHDFHINDDPGSHLYDSADHNPNVLLAQHYAARADHVLIRRSHLDKLDQLASRIDTAGAADDLCTLIRAIAFESRNPPGDW